MQDLDPTYGGIGAYVDNDPDNGQRFTISRPIWGGPVYRAGLHAGDVIMAIDGEPTSASPSRSACAASRAPRARRSSSPCCRPGWTEEQDFALTRAAITIPTTAYDVLPGDDRLPADPVVRRGHRARGRTRSSTQFAAQGVKALVIDLRGNGGGYLQSAVDIASEFLPKGTLVVSERGRPGVYPEQTHVSHGRGAQRPDWPDRASSSTAARRARRRSSRARSRCTARRGSSAR